MVGVSAYQSNSYMMHMCILLSLSENDIEASGVGSLVHCLKYCTKVQELRYCNTIIKKVLFIVI